MFIIYLIKCETNDKLYVGQTSRSLELRFREHLNHASNGKTTCRKLYAAIRKYGVEDFSIHKLCETQTQEEADLLEVKYIKEYNSIQCGYNLQIGGYNGKPSLETRELMSAQRSGENNVMFGKTHSVESRNKISITRRKLYAEGALVPTWKGKLLTQEAKKKISISRKGLTAGENNPGAKLTLDQVEEIRRLFNESDLTQIEIANMFNVSRATIQRIKAGTHWK